MKKMEKLFEPGRIGKLSIRNRIVMAPMGIIGLTEPDGKILQRAIDYYVERAKGGVGLIVTGLFLPPRHRVCTVEKAELLFCTQS